MILRVGLVQMRCEKGAVEANLATTLSHIEEAAAHDIHILAFPEASLSGYSDPRRVPQAALDLDSPPVQRLVTATRGKPLTALVGIVENGGRGAKPYLTQLVIRDGELVGWYRKMTLPNDEDWYNTGTTVPVFYHVGVRFAIAICADSDNAEVFARAAEQGARIVFEVAAPGLYGDQATRDWHAGFEWWKDDCEKHLGGHAKAQQLWIAVATQAGRTVDEDFPGGGYVFAPDGQRLYASPSWTPGVSYLEVNLDAQQVTSIGNTGSN